MSAVMRSVAARRAATAPPSTRRSSLRPVPVVAEVTTTWVSVSPSASSSLRRSDSQSAAWSGLSVSTWLSTTVVTAACPASGTR